MNMGERIKELRISKGYTQEDLGKILGLKKAAIQKYENGDVENIKRSKIKLLADALSVTPSYIIGVMPKGIGSRGLERMIVWLHFGENHQKSNRKC